MANFKVHMCIRLIELLADNIGSCVDPRVFPIVFLEVLEFMAGVEDCNHIEIR